jgi:ketosteroid isomerase-like protein
MKKLIIRFCAPISLFALVLFAGTSCEEKVNIEKEKAAIKAAIQESSDAWNAKDIERISAIWVHDESNVRINAGPGGSGYTQGWEKRKANYENNFKNNPELQGNKEFNSNFNIKVYSESAWAVYDMELKNKAGEVIRGARHTSFLEKQNGQWKMALLSTVLTSAYDNIGKNLETSATYHKLNADDIDTILTDEFIGRNEQSRSTWKRVGHRSYLTNNQAKTDSIYVQMGRGNWIATMFERKWNKDGKELKFQAMQFKRYENGKIAEIFEYGDRKQND